MHFVVSWIMLNLILDHTNGDYPFNEHDSECGDCIIPKEEAGCTNEVILSCVCFWDPVCCRRIFDTYCAAVAITRCGCLADPELGATNGNLEEGSQEVTVENLDSSDVNENLEETSQEFPIEGDESSDMDGKLEETSQKFTVEDHETSGIDESLEQSSQNVGCDCGGDHCFVGGRIYWSHEGILALFHAWIQAAFVPEFYGGGTAPNQVQLVCSGDFTSNGVTETTTKTLTLSSVISESGGDVVVGNMEDYPDILTSLGIVHLKWGSGVLREIEIPSWFQCCLAGSSRYTPLENADDCAPYRICMDVDLRLTNEGPRPPGRFEETGKIDNLFNSGFVVTPVCEDNLINLQIFDAQYAYHHPPFFEPDPTKSGTHSMAEIDGNQPFWTESGALGWDLTNVDWASDDVHSGVFSVNAIVREIELTGSIWVNGTMNIDFLIALDPTLPSCEFTHVEGSYEIGDNVTGSVKLDDRSGIDTEIGSWRNSQDVVHVVSLRGSAPFTLKQTLPFEMNALYMPLELDVLAVCTESGTFSMGIVMLDTCGHTGTCATNYTCHGVPHQL